MEEPKEVRCCATLHTWLEDLNTYKQWLQCTPQYSAETRLTVSYRTLGTVGREAYLIFHLAVSESVGFMSLMTLCVSTALDHDVEPHCCPGNPASQNKRSVRQFSLGEG